LLAPSSTPIIPQLSIRNFPPEKLEGPTLLSSRDVTRSIQSNHTDGKKHNNRPGNLELVTAAENMRHAVDVLGVNQGERGSKAKLTVEQVKRIRWLMAEAIWTERQVAERFGVDPATVSLLYRRKTWKHVN
jgi:hypothetical protein